MFTYESSRPYACKIFNFKSNKYPQIEVMKTSGNKCHAFKEKPTSTTTPR